MKTLFVTYMVTLVVFFAIDLVWLGVVAKNLYANYIGHLMAEKINWIAALLFYLLYILGVVYFAVNPALQGGGWTFALKTGLIFGFFTYMTYDLTNLATLKDWPLKIAIIDMGWGTFLGGFVALFSYIINTLLLK